MASLESLANPLERTGVLPQTMNFNINPLTGSPVWDVARQYFQNDVVISGFDGGAYIYNGASTCILGGTDPSTDPTNWQKTFPNGVSSYDRLTPTFTAAGGGGYTSANNIFLAPSGSEWLVVVQGTCTQSAAAPLAAADVITTSITPNGTGPSVGQIDLLPYVGGLSTRVSGSCVVSVGNGGTTITATCSSNAGNQQGLSLSYTFVRLF